MSDALERTVRLRISAYALRSVEHRGGLDAFLVKAKDDELSPRARLLRKEVLAKRGRERERPPKPPDRLAAAGTEHRDCRRGRRHGGRRRAVERPRPAPLRVHARPAEPRRPPDLGRLLLSARLPGDRHHQPAARARAWRGASSIAASPSRSCCPSGSPTPRIAIASGTAFLVGQLLDIGIFNRLRDRAWWKAPAFSSLAGSVADTADLLHARLRAGSSSCSAPTIRSPSKPRRSSASIRSRRRAGSPGRSAISP